MQRDYQSAFVKQLCDQQVRFAPRDRKVEQVQRAEKLLTEIDPGKTYSYEYVCFRITEFRPDAGPVQTISGVQARHDLRLFVEDVSDSANLRVEEVGEPVHTVEELSALFNVSTKTISRWREEGLVARRLIFGKRKRVGFLRSTVERFVAQHRERIERGDRFRQLSTQDRDGIVEKARQLAGSGACLSEIARHLGQQLGRSPETIRYTLRQFDEQHPDLALFPDHQGPLNEAEKLQIYQAHRRGMGIERLVERYRRTRSSIYRILNEMQFRQLRSLPLDFVDHPDFRAANAEQRFLGPEPPASEASSRRVKPPLGVPSYLATLYETPLLTREQEQHLFARMNYLKFCAVQLLAEIDPNRVRSRQLRRFETLYNQAVEIKNRLVQANLRLVVSIAKRHLTPTEDFFNLVSDGNISLIRAVERFDFARGNKFSTYATWAIMKNYARSIPDESKHRDRFRTSLEELFSGRADDRGGPHEQEAAQLQREQQVRRMLNRLDEREQTIIISRFGLDPTRQPLTLTEVGSELGVTKERIRQLEVRALEKLRAAIRDESVELPDD